MIFCSPFPIQRTSDRTAISMLNLSSSSNSNSSFQVQFKFLTFQKASFDTLLALIILLKSFFFSSAPPDAVDLTSVTPDAVAMFGYNFKQLFIFGLCGYILKDTPVPNIVFCSNNKLLVFFLETPSHKIESVKSLFCIVIQVLSIYH